MFLLDIGPNQHVDGMWRNFPSKLENFRDN